MESGDSLDWQDTDATRQAHDGELRQRGAYETDFGDRLVVTDFQIAELTDQARADVSRPYYPGDAAAETRSRILHDATLLEGGAEIRAALAPSGGRLALTGIQIEELRFSHTLASRAETEPIRVMASGHDLFQPDFDEPTRKVATQAWGRLCGHFDAYRFNRTASSLIDRWTGSGIHMTVPQDGRLIPPSLDYQVDAVSLLTACASGRIRDLRGVGPHKARLLQEFAERSVAQAEAAAQIEHAAAEDPSELL